MPEMTMSAMSPVRNPLHPPSTPLLDPPIWHTSNWDINIKFSGYLPWGKRTSFMTSGITLSSMSLVRNHQCPPSTPFLTPLPDTPPTQISTWKFQCTFIRVKNILLDVRSDPVIHVSGQEPSMSSKYPPSWSPLPDTLPIEISTQNFQGIFLGVEKHQEWHQVWPYHPGLKSGTLNVLQVPCILTSPFSEHF